ncbi:hypothetical protein EW145_g2807 [Phellinidium pouzarii]|uniref:Mitochondrial outer membrane protein IML2 n=1 Tax=Phellinidium pouzarii TaxID=167371 RepID=A0A4S4L9D7_9AGAM|nr:hypothetical protein EW145_g2807 [Phellinidium pouzarii]
MPEKSFSNLQADMLVSASKGFDLLFANQINEARSQFQTDGSMFHLMGLGVCAFLEAALGMETGLMSEASQCLSDSENEAKKQIKAARAANNGKGNFPAGIEFEILQADAIVLQGLVHVLGESYMGYLQCLYALNNGHSKFTKLYKTVFPTGLDFYTTPATTPLPSRNPSTPSLASVDSSKFSGDTISASTTSRGSSFFGRWGLSTPGNPKTRQMVQPEGPVEELIVSGAAFGFGLFNLVFSLLPAKVKSVVGLFGFQHDRRLALQALAVSAARKDVHSVFSGLVLMTYHGVVLLMSGYQADEAYIVKQYNAIVENISSRYPSGALWILNRAKILRMTYDPDGAIAVLQDGLKPALDANWLGCEGCYVSLGDRVMAKELFDKVPELLEKRKLGVAFYKAKAKRRGGDESMYVECMKISPADELAIFWNTHQRITREAAMAHIEELTSLTPVPSNIPRSRIPNLATHTLPADLDTPDEFAVRSLILGIVHRSICDFENSRLFLDDAYHRYDAAESKWIGGVSLFELAVLDLKKLEAREMNANNSAELSSSSLPSAAEWNAVLNAVEEKLDKVMAISGSSLDLSSRLDSRVNMLRDEIATKREKLCL